MCGRRHNLQQPPDESGRSCVGKHGSTLWCASFIIHLRHSLYISSLSPCLLGIVKYSYKEPQSHTKVSVCSVSTQTRSPQCVERRLTVLPEAQHELEVKLQTSLASEETIKYHAYIPFLISSMFLLKHCELICLCFCLLCCAFLGDIYFLLHFPKICYIKCNYCEERFFIYTRWLLILLKIK